MALPDPRQHEKWLSWAIDYIAQYGLDDFRKLLERRVGLKIKMPMNCLWRFWATNEEPKHANLSKHVKAVLAQNGLMERQLLSEKYNTIMDAYKLSIIQHNIGGPSSAQDLEIDYLAVGLSDASANGVPPATTQTQLNREFYRAVPDEKYANGSQTLVVMLYLDAATANPTNTTVASATDERHFAVQTGQGSNYQANDLIRLFIGTYQPVVVESRSGDNITLKAATPLSTTPPVGTSVQRGFGEMALFHGNATGTANTGSMANRAAAPFFKNNVTSILAEVHYDYLS